MEDNIKNKYIEEIDKDSNIYIDNIKLNKTDIEVLQKHVSFFPPDLLNARVRESKPKTPNPITSKPEHNIMTYQQSRSNQQNLKPFNQIRSNRGISMKFM